MGLFDSNQNIYANVTSLEIQRENLISTAQFPIDIAPHQPLFLRLTPSSNATIKQIHAKPGSQVKSYAVSFLSHAQRLQKNLKLSESRKKERNRKNSVSMISPPIVNERKDNVSDEYEDKDDGMGGEISQEETEGSDIDFEDDPEPSCSDTKLDVKEEPTSYLSYSEDEEEEEIQLLTPIPEIKIEKEESDDAINQLMALESVANFDQTHDDEVICLGEKTRLLAQVRDGQPHKADDDTGMEDCEIASIDHEDEDKVYGETVCPKESYDDYVKRIHKGWTVKAISTITIGQLFLMFGEDQKLSLEYSFEEKEEADVEIDSVGVDIDMDCTPLEDSSCNNVSSKDGVDKNSCDQTSSLTFEDNNNKIYPENQDEISSRVFNGCRVSFLENVSSIPESSSHIVAEPIVVTPNVLGSPPSILKASGLPLPDLVDIGVSSPKAETEEVKKMVPEDISRIMNRLFGLMKSLSSPQESCFCRLSALTRTPTGSLKSPIGARCGSNIGKASSTAKSPRGLVFSTRSPRTPTQSFSTSFPISPDASTATHRLQKLKPPSAKRLLTDLPEKMHLNVNESSCKQPSTVADTMELESDQEIANSLSSKVAGEVPSDSVEFRVPIAPAPRTVCQTPNSNFNAQLSKLMPRYSMPSRRAMRKNMLVQRQLPLLPRLPQPHPGYVTLKVLPPQSQGEDIKYLPDAQKLAPLGMKIPAVSTNVNNGFSDKTDVHAIVESSASLSSEKTMSPLLVQQLTVPARLLPASNVSPFEVAPVAISNANAISVNVSGHQLLTVEMPNISQRIFSSVSNLVHKSAIQVSSSEVSSSPLITTIAHSGTSVTFLSTATTTTPTTFAFVNAESLLPINSNTSVSLNENSDSLSSFLNETLGPMAYLNEPICSTKELSTPSNFKGVFPSAAGSVSTLNFECPSDILIRKPTTNPMTSATSMIAPCENSLLNTPIRLLPSDSVEHKNIESVKLNISSLLDSPETSLNQSDEQIPQIHIPDCNTSLPLFDISIGGSISVCETIKGHETLILPSESTEDVSLHEKLANNELTLSVTCVTSSVVTSEAAISKRTADDLSLQAFQDNSCDKMMDITLANSNSNSCFSSLLAATSGSIPPLDSLLENSLLQTPPRPSLRSGRMNLESERFESLSAVPPSPPSSPSRLLHQNDAQWLQHDANEFSLSSLLGSMESPCKSGSSAIPSSEGTLSQSLITALNDNTVDFTSTFARLNNQTKDPNF